MHVHGITWSMTGLSLKTHEGRLLVSEVPKAREPTSIKKHNFLIVLLVSFYGFSCFINFGEIRGRMIGCWTCQLEEQQSLAGKINYCSLRVADVIRHSADFFSASVMPGMLFVQELWEFWRPAAGRERGWWMHIFGVELTVSHDMSFVLHELL